ncbi:MAG: FG-GAP-like repeat-containing protein, partial [Phycisphaerales bacterium]|nr:FG-GAP-like repeat-containing protein [Phycisphaerales bacterium]
MAAKTRTARSSKRTNGAAGGKLDTMAKTVAEMAFRKKTPSPYPLPQWGRGVSGRTLMWGRGVWGCTLLPARLLSNVAVNDRTRHLGWRTVFLFAVWSGSAFASLASAEDTDRLMNLAKAHLENRESAKAVEVLAEVLKADPTSTAALRNLARAHLIARKHEAAVEAVTQAEKVEPDSPATAYLKGLALLRRSRFDQAIGPLETAVRGDPNTTALRYQLACAYEGVGRDEKAGEQFHETLRLDPLHAGAYFKLAAQARKANLPEEAEKYQNEFVRLKRLLGEAARSADALEQCVHTRPEGATIPARRDDRAATRAVIEVRFEDATDAVFPAGPRSHDLGHPRGAAAAAVIEVDAEGRCAIFVADGDGALSVMRLSKEGVFERKAVESPGAPGLKGPVRAFAADYHDDVPPGVRYDAKLHALTDVLLVGSDRLYLLKQTAPGVYSDVTRQSGLPEGGANAARWFDYEHDGDVDLLLPRDGGLELWQNNGDGRFENVTQRVGIQPTGPAMDAAIGDLDGNEATDFVVARGKAATPVYLNQRAGRFTLMSEPPGPWPPASRAIINDLDNDGRLDTVLLGRKEAALQFGGTGGSI